MIVFLRRFRNVTFAEKLYANDNQMHLSFSILFVNSLLHQA